MIKAEWTNADALDLQPTCNQLATDLISRQAVIDALTHKWDGMVTSVFDVLKELPSAQPERKKEKCVWCDSPFRIEYYWIDREGCTASFQDEERHLVATGIANYCPNCGADLRGEQNG